MNAFTHTVDGGNEFTFVVSRASANADDKVHAVAARTLRELKDTLTDFYLESTQMLTVDGYPAVELFYQFKNDNRVIFQRKKLVSYVATCPGEFNERHQQQYQEIIQSIKFHRGK